MYGENKLRDAVRLSRGFATNLIARFAPAYYFQTVGETGRGSGGNQPDAIYRYFRNCFDDYFRMLGVPPSEIVDYVRGMHVLEYGPGDLPLVGLLMYAYGADRITCVDRFPLVSFSQRNLDVIRVMLDDLQGEARRRAESCFRTHGDPRSGLDSSKIALSIRPKGLSGCAGDVDLVISRAVLEHVDDLEAVIDDSAKALRAGGIGIHKVDLSSHGLHMRNPLDFLSWPSWAWRLMFSHKGMPNRLRVDSYRNAVASSGLQLRHMEPTAVADPKHVQEVRARLDQPFRTISDEDLKWLGLWLVTQRAPS